MYINSKCVYIYIHDNIMCIYTYIHICFHIYLNTACVYCLWHKMLDTWWSCWLEVNSPRWITTSGRFVQVAFTNASGPRSSSVKNAGARMPSPAFVERLGELTRHAFLTYQAF